MNLAILCSTLLIILSALGTLALAVVQAGALPSTTWFIGLYTGLTLLFIFVIWKYKDEESHAKLLALIVGAIAARVIFCFAPSVLNPEIWRYLWEGSLMREGLNPYLHAPLEASSLGILSPNITWIQNSTLPAIDPPYAQYLFSTFCLSEFTWKLFIVACDIVNILILVRILDILGKAPSNVLYYAYLPLALIEFGASGHTESVLILCVLSFIYFSLIRPNENSWMHLGFFAASGFLIKFVSILPAAFFLFKKNLFPASDKRKVGFLLLIISVLIYLPFLEPNMSTFISFKNYALNSRFNDSLLHTLVSILGVESIQWIKIILGVCWLGIIICILKHEASWLKASMYSLALLALMGSVFNPWYALWFAPFLCIFHSWALLYLVLVIPLSYSALFINGNVPVLIKVIEFVPVWILLIRELYQLKSKTNHSFK